MVGGDADAAGKGIGIAAGAVDRSTKTVGERTEGSTGG